MPGLKSRAVKVARSGVKYVHNKRLQNLVNKPVSMVGFEDQTLDQLGQTADHSEERNGKI